MAQNVRSLSRGSGKNTLRRSSGVTNKSRPGKFCDMAGQNHERDEYAASPAPKLCWLRVICREVRMMGRRSNRALAAVVALGAIAMAPVTAKADNGGVGFWLPGTMGSLSAVPGQPGMSYTFQYIHLESVAGGGKAFQNNASIVAGLHAKADAGLLLPT